MPADEILTRLTDRFRILGAARTATGRHRTLHAAIAWSYDLCTPAEQRLWAELSVFPAGFGLAAAERVCGPGTAKTLIRLVEKSVVQYSDASRRYQLLDTMREFGAERLAQTAVQADPGPPRPAPPSCGPGTATTTVTWRRRAPRPGSGPSRPAGWPGSAPKPTTCGPPSTSRSPSAGSRTRGCC